MTKVDEQTALEDTRKFFELHDDITHYLFLLPNKQTIKMFVDGKGSKECPDIAEDLINCVKNKTYGIRE